MDRAECVSFDEFFNCTLENTVTHLSQGLKAQQQYLNFIPVTSYVNNKRQMWKKNNL